MNTNSIGFIGGGRITRIFLQGFKNKQVNFETIKVFEPNAETLKILIKNFPNIKKAEIAEAAAVMPLVVLAVHPPVIMDKLKKVKDVIGENTVVISLAPKITIEDIASVLSTKKIVRMIPNATSFINEGFNPVTFHPEFEAGEKKEITDLLNTLGKTFETEETKLESYAIVSAMLPTYFWFQWLEIERIAKVTGLSEREAKEAIQSTLKAALELFYTSNLTPEAVMDLIPVKPIADAETEIIDILDTHLMKLWLKIKP